MVDNLVKNVQAADTLLLAQETGKGNVGVTIDTDRAFVCGAKLWCSRNVVEIACSTCILTTIIRLRTTT